MSTFEKIEQLWKEYAAHYDSWENLEPYFESLYHNDFTLSNGTQELNREEAKNAIIAMVSKNTIIEDFKILKTEGEDTIHYTAAITPRGQSTMHPTSKGIIKDGKMWRIETNANYMKK